MYRIVFSALVSCCFFIYTQAQELPVRKIYIQAIEYVHQSGTWSETTMENFLNQEAYRDSLLQQIALVFGEHYKADIQPSTSFTLKTSSRNISGTGVPALPRFKPKLNSADDKAAYLFIHIFGEDVKNNITDWTIRHIILNEGKQVAQGQSVVRATTPLNRPLKRLSPKDYLNFLHTGLTAFFNPEMKTEISIPDDLPAKEEALKSLFPAYQKIPIRIQDYNYILTGRETEKWQHWMSKEDFNYIKKNIGGDVAENLLASAVGISSSTYRKLQYQYDIEIKKDNGEFIILQMWINGKREKEKTRTWYLNEELKPRRDVTTNKFFYKAADYTTTAECIMSGGISLRLGIIPKDEILNDISKAALIDSIFFRYEKQKEQIPESALNNGNIFGWRGNWMQNTFRIIYRYNNNMTQYFWNDELVAFSLQRDFAPALYIISESEAPFSKLAVLQHVLYFNLFNWYRVP